MTPKPRPKIRRDAQRVHASLADRVAHLERVCARIRMGDMTATDEVTLAGDDAALEANAVGPAPVGSRVAALTAGGGQNPLILGAVGNRAWQTWTPTWTNLDPAKVNVTARYLDLGGIVFGTLAATVNDTTPISGSVSLAPPVTLANQGDQMAAGHLMCVDASAGNAITYGVVRIGSGASPTLQFLTSQASGTYLTAATFNATIPFTWTTGDRFSFQFWARTA